MRSRGNIAEKLFAKREADRFSRPHLLKKTVKVTAAPSKPFSPERKSETGNDREVHSPGQTPSRGPVHGLQNPESSLSKVFGRIQNSEGCHFFLFGVDTGNKKVFFQAKRPADQRKRLNFAGQRRIHQHAAGFPKARVRDQPARDAPAFLLSPCRSDF